MCQHGNQRKKNQNIRRAGSEGAKECLHAEVAENFHHEFP
jgi:hypothetical protein